MAASEEILGQLDMTRGAADDDRRTQRIAIGDRVLIDGTAGTVEILRDEPGRSATAPATAIGR